MRVSRFARVASATIELSAPSRFNRRCRDGVCSCPSDRGLKPTAKFRRRYAADESCQVLQKVGERLILDTHLQTAVNEAFGQNLILMTSSSWRASYVFCVYVPHVLVEFVCVSNNRPTFRFSVGLSFIVAGSAVAPKEVLSPGLNCVLLNRFVACAARLTETRSHILKDFSSDMFTFQVALLRMSPKVAADAPYQK